MEVKIGRSQQEKESLGSQRNRRSVAVVSRVFIPPHESAVVDVQCEEELEEAADRAIWPFREGVAAGVYKVVQK